MLTMQGASVLRAHSIYPTSRSLSSIGILDALHEPSQLSGAPIEVRRWWANISGSDGGGRRLLFLLRHSLS